MHELTLNQFPITKPLFAPLTHHLVVESILAGLTPGRMFVDDVIAPRTAVAWFQRRLFLAGEWTQTAVNHALHHLITTVYYPELAAIGPRWTAFTLVYTPGWQDVMDVVLAGKHPLAGQRLCYHLHPAGQDWQPSLPPGFALRPVDAALLADAAIQNLDYVTDEMVSERPSVPDFLAKSFGACIVHQGQIVGWCMSEYNVGSRCELGIETDDAYQRRGLARATATAVIREAVARGLTEIGWICEADNLPSIATAEHLGFELHQADPTFYAFIDPAINLGVNGNVYFGQQRYDEALVWYNRALALEDVPIWLIWNAACAHARLGDQPNAFATLHRALDAGFDDRHRLETSDHLQALRGVPEWTAVLARLP
jgi:RimJ/RimL family protein N-acetyltransferase